MLIRPGDVNALARAIESALQVPGWRQQTGDRARKFVSDHFRLAVISRRYEELYEELLDEKNWRPTKSDTGKVRRRTRVVIVAASPRYVGGQSVQAELLERSWRDDQEVEASFVAIDPSFPGWLQWVEAFPGIRTLFRLPLYFQNLWRAFESADVAHIFSASYWSFLVAPVPAWLVARSRGAKVLIHYHSGEAHDHLRRSRMARLVLSRVDKIVVPSKFLVDVFREFGLPAEVVPNGVDLSQFRFRPRRQVPPHLICTRGFHPYYCVDVVVRAFAEVQKQYPQAELDLLGAGKTEGGIRDLVGELKLAKVRFAGVVSREKIADHYDRADIFINASRLDNMPVSILEAYAGGLPVVSTAPEGMCYVVDDGRTGLLSEVGNPRALAANVLRLLSDGGLASNLASNALEKCKQYEWRLVRQQWLAVYESLVDVADSH